MVCFVDEQYKGRIHRCRNAINNDQLQWVEHEPGSLLDGQFFDAEIRYNGAVHG